MPIHIGLLLSSGQRRCEVMVYSRRLQEQEPEGGAAGVCSPTPTTFVGATFEVLSLETELASMSMDVVSAYPHAKEKEDVCMPAPNEFEEAGKGYGSVVHGLSRQNMAKHRSLLKLARAQAGGRIGAANSKGSRQSCINIGLNSSDCRW